MAFSLRSFFGKGGSEPAATPGSNGVATNVQDPQSASPFTAVGPAPGATPGSAPFASNLLFKTAAPSEPLGQPVAPVVLSPFSPVSEPQAGLTVGDLLSALPPDVAKNPGLPATQPVAIPEAVLDNALRSGRPVLPLFEVYRAFPAMFQTPVAPNDTREVPLPLHKLAHLLSKKTSEPVASGAPGLGVMPPSPFAGSPFVPGAQAGTTASSPFAMASAVPEPPAMGNPETTLFHPSPFSMAMTPDSSPAAGGAGAAPPAFSPGSVPAFGGMTMPNPFVTAPVVTASSPFSLAPSSGPAEPIQVPNPVPPTPYAPAPEQVPLGSLFGQPPTYTEPAAAPSPFGQSFGMPAPGAAGSTPSAESPFGSAAPFTGAPPSSGNAPSPTSPFQGLSFPPPAQKLPDFQPQNVNPFATSDMPPAGSDPMKGLFTQTAPPFSSPAADFSPPASPSPAEAAQPFQPFVPGPAAAPVPPVQETPVFPMGPPAASFLPPSTLAQPVPAMASPFQDQAASPSPGGSFPSVPASVTPDNPFARIQALAKGMGSPPVAAPVPEAPPATAFGTRLPAEMFGNPAPQAPPAAELNAAPKSTFPDFSKLAPAAVPDMPFDVETPAAPPAAAGILSGNFSMSLATALKNCAPHDLGTVPENIPAWVKFTIPLEKIQMQLAGSRVRLPLDEILAGTDVEVRRMFASARAGLVVELEMNAVFHALSEGSSASPAPAPKAVEKKPEAVLPPTQPQALFAPPSVDPFAPVPETAWKSDSLPAPAPETAGINPFWGDQPDGGGLPVSSFMLEPEESQKPVPPFPAFHPEVELPQPAMPPSAFTPAPPVATRPVVIPANPVTGTPEVVSAPPVSPVKITLPKAAAPSAAPVSTGANSTRRLLLTILLGSAEAEDVSTFVKLTRQLPGVAAAVCLHHGKTLASDGDGTPGADRFLREASANAQMLPSLAALTGIEDSDTLHIKSGHGEATFCLHDSVVLAVLHNPEKREAVLREKITLLGRELAAMVRESGAA